MLDYVPGLGINSSHDSSNRLTVSAEAALLNHDGAGHQLKINKAAEADTASLLFQTGFLGRAEMGTAGDDNWSIKVSADGATWIDGMVIDAASGMATLTIDGTPYDLSAVPEGGEGEWPDSPISGKITRQGGKLHVTVRVVLGDGAESKQPADPSHWVIENASGDVAIPALRKTKEAT